MATDVGTVMNVINELEEIYNEKYSEILEREFTMQFLNGWCIYMACILKTIFPEGEIVYNKDKDHMALKLSYNGKDYIWDAGGYYRSEEEKAGYYPVAESLITDFFYERDKVRHEFLEQACMEMAGHFTQEPLKLI